MTVESLWPRNQTFEEMIARLEKAAEHADALARIAPVARRDMYLETARLHWEASAGIRSLTFTGDDDCTCTTCGHGHRSEAYGGV